MKVALTQRISKLEKKVASQIRTGPSRAQSVYQPSEADLAEAVAILVKRGEMPPMGKGEPVAEPG